MHEYVTILISVLTALGGFKFIEYLLNLRSNRTKAQSEANKSHNSVLDDYVEGWKSLCDQQGIELDRKNNRIDQLYKDIDLYRSREHELLTENTALKLMASELKYTKCTVNGCKDRTPPREFNNQ